MSGAPVGFFGKLPSHGDFIARRVDDAFRERWDEWLQRAIAESQRSLGAAWLDCYLTGPLWRFFLSEGIAGGACFAGVLMPSVDRVGRYFPLTVVAQLPVDVAPLAFAQAAQGWFESIEQLCVESLQTEGLDLAAFDAALESSGTMLAELNLSAASGFFQSGAPQWRWATSGTQSIDGTLGRALIASAQGALRPMTMWWTDGSAHVQPSVLITRNLPSPHSFAALLAGNWADGGWEGDLHHMVDPLAETLTVEAPLAVSSAGATDPGTVRAENQDAYVLQDGNRIWAVADGMGGHRNGDVASGMVADALNSLEPSASVDTALESVQRALGRVNADLRRAAQLQGAGSTSGSTVVMLAIRGATYAVCWAGDSRAYLFRGGELAQLTQDHVDAPVANGDSVRSGEITRAIGGDETLELDHVVSDVVAGDRFLLCSDGLYDALEASAILRCLQLPDAQQTVEALIVEARKAGAKDNVTAVIVDARGLAPTS